MIVCAVVGCDRARRKREWCHSHYEQWRRTGLVPTKPFLDTIEARFLAKVDKRDDGHWIWTGSFDGAGNYGGFQYKGKVRRAHRVSYELFVGPIPDGLEVDHLCRVRACVRPDHLEPVTHLENVLRGVSLQAQNAAKDVCHRGHDLNDPANVRRHGPGLRHRSCRACRRELYLLRKPERHCAVCDAVLAPRRRVTCAGECWTIYDANRKREYGRRYYLEVSKAKRVAS